MIDLEQKIRKHRDEALQEIRGLEVKVKVLDDLLEDLMKGRVAASKAPSPKIGKPGPPRGEINSLVMAACVDWKTADDLVKEVPGLADRSKSNLSTRCRLLWLNGHLERRDRRAFRKAYAPSGKLIQKEYEYKVKEDT